MTIKERFTRIEGLRVYFQVEQQSFMVYEALEDEPDSVEWMQKQLVMAIEKLIQMPDEDLFETLEKDKGNQ